MESVTVTNGVLVGDDTDLLVRLCYIASLEFPDLFFLPELKKNTKNHRIWYIKVVKEQLGSGICRRIIFLHAILGCDISPLQDRERSFPQSIKDKQSLS